MTRKEHFLRVGGLSAPGKMPCKGWGIPASKCNVGGKLRTVKGSVCSKCYALKGRYVFPVVQEALSRRLEAYNANPKGFEESMIALLSGESHFRWFDSGDIQGEKMLSSIVRIARALPSTKFWLPTKEAFLVSKWLARNPEGFPPNLVVRLALPMLGMLPTGKCYLPQSGVSSEGYNCPSSRQGGKCLSCRKCWTASDVVYRAH